MGSGFTDDTAKEGELCAQVQAWKPVGREACVPRALRVPCMAHCSPEHRLGQGWARK